MFYCACTYNLLNYIIAFKFHFSYFLLPIYCAITKYIHVQVDIGAILNIVLSVYNEWSGNILNIAINRVRKTLDILNNNNIRICIILK